ncbi:MAG TPA: hypothetical protein VJ722_03050, partial [Rhodanobacteraceae bacterium]|nr:hypothetical protein [Rhodanobacteraceae bacterium]
SPDGTNCRNNGSPCFPWDPVYLSNVSALQSLITGSTAGYEVDLINNDLKVPYSDQFSLGMRNTIGEWNTSATVARILSHDGFVFTLGNRFPDGSFWMNGGQPWGDGVPGFGSLIIGNNGIETRTTQVLLSAEKPYTRDSHWGVTIAYTYTNAHQNRDINEHYSFDEATIEDYPFILSNAAPKHRLVATGVVDGPWGLTFSTKITLATPTPTNNFTCYTDGTSVFPTGSHCSPMARVPTGGKSFLSGPMWGYRSVDFELTKDWLIAGNTHLYLRGDLINAFNFKNYTDVTLATSPGAVLSNDIAYYNTTGNITGVPRTFRISAGVRW